MTRKEWIENLGIDKFLELNSKLQTKKNEAIKILNEKGILKKEGKNEFDKYSYFSEAQYKQLVNELFSKTNLSLKFNEIEYTTFEGTEKQSNGRMPKLEFELMDCETGFFETTVITGEGIDKGDKAGYKAYTGALKYYLANTFMVATGDDPEKESPKAKMNTKITKKDAGTYKLDFGKHSGKTIDEIQKENPEYLEWLLGNTNDGNLTKIIELVTGKKKETTEESKEKMLLMVELDNLMNAQEVSREHLYKHYKVKSNKDLTIAQLKDAIERLKERV